MASGDVFRVNLHMKWGTVECRPGFHLVEGAGGGGTDPLTDCASAVISALGADPLTGFSDQCSITGIEVQDIQPGVAPTALVTITPLVGDEVDVNPLPPQSAGVISLRTGVKGVTGVYATAGRMYMPGIPQTGQISGFLQGGFQLALYTFAGLLGAAFVIDGTAYQWHIVSYVPASKPIAIRAINPVIAWSINNVVRSQRRREYGVGI